MKKVAVIFNGKRKHWEAHYYNLWFKIFPLGNALTYITSSAISIDRLKEDVAQELNGRYKLIEIYDF